MSKLRKFIRRVVKPTEYVGQTELRQNIYHYISLAESGVRVVVVKHNKPIVRITKEG